jgi:hypothetical protein
MIKFKEYLNESKKVETILKDVIYKIKTFDKPKTKQLRDRMVINKMKEKRNKIKNSKLKTEYQTIIDKLESDITK